MYIENGMSVKNPVQCVDLSTSGSVGLNWSNMHGHSIQVISSEISTNKCNTLQENCKERKYVLIEQTDFNFL